MINMRKLVKRMSHRLKSAVSLCPFRKLILNKMFAEEKMFIVTGEKKIISLNLISLLVSLLEVCQSRRFIPILGNPFTN